MSTFVSRIDAALLAEGDFAELVYNSCINYMVRRLITTAEYLKRKCDKEGLPDPGRRFIISLRSFIRNETDIPDRGIEKILILLVECTHARNREPTLFAKERVRKDARNQGVRCYICGRELDFAQHDLVVVEHVWPKAVGGGNETFNLRMCCSDCNSRKADYVDASDFHYEEISLVSDKGDEHFSNELRGEYRVALWAKSAYTCVICGKPASYVGELELDRRNPNDSWHFLNIDAYCGQHAPR
jgi:5-methylcytosine-specific restriction endonuclease McrA